MESKFGSVLCIFTFTLIGFICANDGKNPDFVVGELIKDIRLCRGETSSRRYYIKCETQWANSDAAVFQGIVAAYHSGKLEHSEEAVSELERLKKLYRSQHSYAVTL
ncbi:uncharacterized protein LOC141850916 [Brevipalpus obovatus]|uniref:uncharacterized protein LOC141850916 n=1 Tax=Brevipalpus obovatus TaxID=246614 RepID=UPI003D9F9302